MAALSARVDLSASVQLVGAVACRLAERSSIRVLLIKGAPATASRVRSDRPSVDVDLWVEPDRFEDFLALLEERGWVRYTCNAERLGWGHAVTMTHPDWPCSVDVHRRFPGLLDCDKVVFDAVWRTRDVAVVGQQRVAVPSRVAAAAITVLHAARSMDPITQGDRACALAAASAFSSDERQELSELAAATGSWASLADLLEAAGQVVPEGGVAGRQTEEWRLQLRLRARPGGAWLLSLRCASWSQRARLMTTLVQPAQRDYMEAGADRGSVGAPRATLYRYKRGLRALPGAWRALRAPGVV